CARTLRQVAQADLPAGDRAPRAMVEGSRGAEAGEDVFRALAAAYRGRAHSARRSGEEFEGAGYGDRDARRIGGAVGALERLARATAQAAAGVVPLVEFSHRLRSYA